jgi:hypothetical protein
MWGDNAMCMSVPEKINTYLGNSWRGIACGVLHLILGVYFIELNDGPLDGLDRVVLGIVYLGGWATVRTTPQAIELGLTFRRLSFRAYFLGTSGSLILIALMLLLKPQSPVVACFFGIIAAISLCFLAHFSTIDVMVERSRYKRHIGPKNRTN